MFTVKTVSQYAIANKDDFIARVREASAVQQDNAAKELKRKLNKDKKRYEELDLLYKRLYESYAVGKISEEKFDMLSSGYLLKSIFLIFSRIADEMEEVRVNMLALEYDRFEGYPDEKTMQKQVQTYRALEAKAADLDQEKLNEKRMSIRPQKEEIAKTRISDMYGYCQDNFFRASKNAVAKRLGEQPADIEKQEPNKQTVPAPSRLSGRKKKDNREER